MVIASSSSTASRHRFFEEAPETISVPVAELLAKLPAEYRKENQHESENGRVIALPCRDLLDGNTPRLSLGQLSDLLPELVTVPEGRDHSQKLDLPAGWIALHYCLVTRFEEIVPEEVKATASSATPQQLVPSQPSIRSERERKTPAKITVIEADMVPAKSTAEGGIRENRENEEAPKADIAPAVEVNTEPLAAPLPRRGFFASLPIFRRNVSSKPSAGDGGLVAIVPPKESRNVAPKTLALDPLWKLDPLDQLADPSALQGLFMTEEKLTLDRVIALAGQLPGLRACVLAHGEKVVCASNTPPGVDLKTLSGQAMTMLAQIKESSSNMGLGTVPAVTLHGEQGALSFLHNGELCLLVLHADRGFLPGVRERLQEMLGHLSRAKALPGGPAAQASLPI